MDHGLMSLLVYAAIGLATGLLFWWVRAQRGSPIDPASPEWVQAKQKAQSTLPLMAQLHAQGLGPLLVKFCLSNKSGATEHVWGELESVERSSFRATLATPLLDAATKSGTSHTLPLAEIEDWQLEMPDGMIRGGFTTQAQIAIARRSRRPIPRHIAAMEGRFVDA